MLRSKSMGIGLVRFANYASKPYASLAREDPLVVQFEKTNAWRT
jgi:hypothetical protein